MEQEFSLLIVFAAGLLSFLSPCVLPLIPGYIAFVSGLSVTDMTEREPTDKILASSMLNSVLFVIGFSAVFVLLGIMMITGKLTLIAAKLGFLNRLVW